jgi:hypothetical protein
MGSVASIEHEYQAYREFIQDKLSGAAEVRSEPILLADSAWRGLRYHLVGSGIFEVESLIDFFRHASVKDIWHVLEKRLFARLEPLWQFSTPSPQFSLRDSYDRLLPVNLILTPATPPPGATSHPLTANAPNDPPPKQGDYVRVEGFVVEEVDQDNKSITLNLPPTRTGPSASHRLRFQSIAPMPLHRPGDTIDRLKGQVCNPLRFVTRADNARAWSGVCDHAHAKPTRRSHDHFTQPDGRPAEHLERAPRCACRLYPWRSEPGKRPG